MQEIKPYHQNFTFLEKPIKISEQVWVPDVTPFLSISCITYNHEKFIRDAIEGFLMQETTFPVEILIHDDASTDNTANIIREYEQRYPQLIKPIYQTENQYQKKIKIGPTYQYPRAKGKYLAACEGDDYWIYPHKIQKQIDFLESRSEFVFCCHLVNDVDVNGDLLRKPPEVQNMIYYSSDEIFRTHFSTVSIVYRNVGLKYPDELLNVYNGDVVLFGMLSCYGKAALMNFLGASYRRHEGGIYSRRNVMETRMKSLQTRRIMISSSFFNEKQKHILRREILSRKVRLLKYCLKTFRFSGLLKAMAI